MTETKVAYEAKVPTLEQQLSQLNQLVDTAFVKTAREVKGSFTSGDYVTWLLNKIFTPACWSFTILHGPEMITLNDSAAYAQVIGRLEVIFADGTQAHQDDVGIWPLVATKAREGGTLEETAPERYETACKAARTDCLKNAAYNLGTCFAPLSDGALVGFLQREEAKDKLPPLNESADKSKADLFGIAKEREGEVGSNTLANNQVLTNAGAVRVWLKVKADLADTSHPAENAYAVHSGELAKALEGMGFKAAEVMRAAWGKKPWNVSQVIALQQLTRRTNAKAEIQYLLE